MTQQSEIRVLNDSGGLFKAAAKEFSLLASSAVLTKGSFCVALSGGSTPKGLYTQLADKDAPAVPWAQTSFFFSDERFVPPTDPESNFRMADEALLSKLRLRPQNIFRVPTEEPDPGAAARQYEQAIQTYFALSPGQFPRFDLILLGLGPDGHTASLFPGTSALREESRLVTSNRVEKLSADRITFTYPLINHAACVMFLVSGKEKAGILRQVFEDDKADLPAQKVRPANGKLLWLIDRAAAGALSGEKV
jgi:6-phosphogluconolactonase